MNNDGEDTIYTNGGAYIGGSVNTSGGDFIGGSKISIHISERVSNLHTDFGSRIKNFLNYYKGGEDSPAPFGGRDADLRALDSWFDGTHSAPYALLVAPAGRGKSALLAHWITRFDSSESIHLIYFPISIRFNTNLENIIFAALASKLAKIHNENISDVKDIQQYRGLFSDYLCRTPQEDKKILVVLDGLDEAAGWAIGPDVFPLPCPAYLRVLVATRPLAGDVDETAWLRRLGWDQSNSAKVFPLKLLNKEGVRDVLAKYEPTRLEWTERADFVSGLYKLSGGDPLVLRMYIETMGEKLGEDLSIIQMGLSDLRPGLEAFFEKWFDDQRKLWGNENPLREKMVRGFLYLCSVAKGPLSSNDVLSLAKDYIEDSLLLRLAIEQVKRFVIGDGIKVGFAFSHPRLREFFASQLSKIEREEWNNRFLEYGSETIKALKEHRLPRKQASQYIVQYYGVHLEEANAPNTKFFEMVSYEWLSAWQEFDDTYQGFLNDLYKAWRRADFQNQQGSLTVQLKCALCRSSIATINTNVDEELLYLGIENQQISPTQALNYIKQNPDVWQQKEAIIKIFPFLAASSDSIRIVLEIIRNSPTPKYVVEILTRFAPYLTRELENDVLEVASGISKVENRLEAYISLLAFLSPEGRPRIEQEALELTAQITEPKDKFAILRALSSQFSGDLRRAALKNAYDTYRSIDSIQTRIRTAPELAALLGNPLRDEVLQVALMEIPKVPDGDSFFKSDRVKLLAELVKDLSVGLKHCALEVALSFPEHEEKINALLEIIEYLPEDLLIEANQFVKKIEEYPGRIKVLAKIAHYLPEGQQEKVVSEELGHLLSIPDRRQKVDILLFILPFLQGKFFETVLKITIEETYQLLPKSSFGSPRLIKLEQLIPFLSGVTREKAIVDAFELISGLEKEDLLGHPRVEAVMNLAPFLPETLLDEYLKFIESAQDITEQLNCCLKAIPFLTGSVKEYWVHSVLIKIDTFKDPQQREGYLERLIPLVPADRVAILLTEIIATLPEFPERINHWKFPQVKVLTGYAPLFNVGHLSSAYEVAKGIKDPRVKSLALERLIPYLPEPLKKSALQEAFKTANVIGDYDDSIKLLVGLFPNLTNPLKGQVYEFARRISIDGVRAERIIQLVPHLPEELKLVACQNAISAAQSVKYSGWRFMLLADLLPQLPLELRSAISDEIVEIFLQWEGIEYIQWDELSKSIRQVVPVLSKIHLRKLFHKSRSLKDEHYRVQFLIELIPYLPRDLWLSARDIAEEIKNIGQKTRLREALAIHWSQPHSLKQMILDNIAFFVRKAKKQGGLSNINEKILDEALVLAMSETQPATRTHLYSLMLKHVQGDQYIHLLKEAYDSALQVKDEISQLHALVDLIPYFPEDFLLEIFNKAISIGHGSKRVYLISRFLPHLPEKARELAVREAFETIVEFFDIDPWGERERSDAFESISDTLVWWAQKEPEMAQKAWNDNLYRLAKSSRETFLLDMVSLTPFFMEFVPEEMRGVEAEGIMKALLDIRAWWP